MQERKAGKVESVGAESSSTLSEKTVTPEEKIQNHKRDNKHGLTVHASSCELSCSPAHREAHASPDLFIVDLSQAN